MRQLFDEVCFGWLHDDRTFEPLPMPTEWRYDARGSQILESRVVAGHFQPPVWQANAHYPSSAEKHEAFMRAHPDLAQAMTSDDPRVYADEIHQMDWSEYAMLVLDEQERQQVRRNGWRLFRLAACIVLIQLATAATITTLMQ